MKGIKIKELLKNNEITNKSKLVFFIKNNINNYTLEEIGFIFEKGKHSLLKDKSKDEGVFFTKEEYVNEIIKDLIIINKEEINILEPSVGMGGFLNGIINKFKKIKKVNLYLNDIDNDGIELLKYLIDNGKIQIPNNFKIYYSSKDFLIHDFGIKFDYIIGNPPYTKKSNNIKLYKNLFNNKKTNNLFAFFIEKAIKISNYVNFIIPKSFLFVGEFQSIRNKIKGNIEEIVDFNKEVFNVNIT